MKEIVDWLITRNETISTMESCTGGAVSSAITNIEGASAVFSFSAITYSNEAKIKMGVSEETIKKYSVYSEEVAKEMSREISLFTNSTYGIGVTGKINREDSNNPTGDNNVVYISIYDKKKNSYQTNRIELPTIDRWKCKDMIVEEIIELLAVIQKSYL